MTCNMFGYISDKTEIDGQKWEVYKQSNTQPAAGDEELYDALRSRQDALDDNSAVLPPTLYNEHTRSRCQIEFKIYASFHD